MRVVLGYDLAGSAGLRSCGAVRVSVVTAAARAAKDRTAMAVFRLESRIAIEELTRRYPALELAAPPTRRPLLVLRGFDSVPVRATQMPSQSAA